MTTMLNSFTNSDNFSSLSSTSDHVFSHYREKDDTLYTSQYPPQSTTIQTTTTEKNLNNNNHDKLSSSVIIGKPFSALINSLIPSPEYLLNDNDEQIIYDEYGFRIDINENEQQYEIVPMIENESNKLKWLTHLDSKYKIDVVHLPIQDQELVDKIDSNQFRQDPRISLLLQQSFGIPLSIRAQIWMCLSGSLHKKYQAKMSYIDMLKQCNNDAQLYSKQIEKDLLRTLPTNACFMSINASGISRLRRVLRAIAWLFPG
ncbi:unnamed protein product [Rotaria sordida]|uniref:Rab-GAP TBC domain-containing protein n=1 Tax=Rotaria sordida TaxID=392033 RepID=A0A819WVY9_9BILA|nr:unnamed protein product [Rotaria sordida]CAF1104308.1 unnamed protein product [Rotaria sordida]CAF4131238.1 unnamed protein product [Rotaria sordida]